MRLFVQICSGFLAAVVVALLYLTVLGYSSTDYLVGNQILDMTNPQTVEWAIQQDGLHCRRTTGPIPLPYVGVQIPAVSTDGDCGSQSLMSLVLLVLLPAALGYIGFWLTGRLLAKPT